jgi:phosphohistidine phosphatase SixA
VLSSPWCRTQETAQLAFGKVSVARGKLFDTGYLDDDSDARKRFRKELERLLSNHPPGGTNTVLVGHMPQLQDETGISLPEGYAAIVLPEGGDYEIMVKSLSPSGWAGLARKKGP